MPTREWKFIHLHCPNPPIGPGYHGFFSHAEPTPPERCPLCGRTLGKLNEFGVENVVADQQGMGRITCG